MPKTRSRGAVAPLRRLADSPRRAALLPSVTEAVRTERPSVPMHCLRPGVLSATAARFVAAFPGNVLYAVKCNPEPTVLRALWAGGVRHFDCASLGEVRLVRQMFPEAAIHFMHPIKSRPAIREAWERHGVRDFVLDGVDELAKILEETGGGRDIGLVVRLAVPKGGAAWDLSGKFGAEPEAASRLLAECARVSPRVGLSFHVGSQCNDPASWLRALELSRTVVARSGVRLSMLDVGGGFPVAYPDIEPRPLDEFMAAIRRGVEAMALPADCQLWCEPGRALVAAGASVVVQVQGQRDGFLFINDGVYGALSDAGAPGFRFPCRLIRLEGPAPSAELAAFSFYGPTCDSMDKMKGPFLLPRDAAEGDWIEIGQLGAYGACLRTPFNGFDHAIMVEVRDPPVDTVSGFSLDVHAA